MTTQPDSTDLSNDDTPPELEPIGFDGVVEYLTRNGEQARQDLGDYFTNYRGRWFEHFSELGSPRAFDANDLAACAALSTPIEGRSVDGLWSRINVLNDALARCPGRQVTLADVDPGSSEYAALSELYDTIRSIDGMGKVRTSKLLASKRPSFVPIRDRHVEAILGAGAEWWTPWRELVRQPGIDDLVAAVTPGGAAGATLLRRLDVILWKEAERRAAPSRS